MTAQELFETWAPDGSVWTQWAKPVLFAHVLGDVAPAPGAPAAAAAGPIEAWPPAADGATALVVDLPGDAAVAEGASLARRGYRPVPLFNGNVGRSAVVDPAPILRALVDHAPALAALALRAAAPPAFLLDARRMRPERRPRAGDFDNRWMVFPQDVPSGARLAEGGIRRVVVIQRGLALADDLSHVLRRWQEAGIGIAVRDAAAQTGPTAVSVGAPPRFRSIWYRAQALLGLRRSLVGGFGGQIPAAGGGFG